MRSNKQNNPLRWLEVSCVHACTCHARACTQLIPDACEWRQRMSTERRARGCRCTVDADKQKNESWRLTDRKGHRTQMKEDPRPNLHQRFVSNTKRIVNFIVPEGKKLTAPAGRSCHCLNLHVKPGNANLSVSKNNLCFYCLLFRSVYVFDQNLSPLSRLCLNWYRLF